MAGWREPETLNGEDFSPPVLGERTALNGSSVTPRGLGLDPSLFDEKGNYSASFTFLPDAPVSSEADHMYRISRMQGQLLSMMYGLQKAVEEGNRRIEERLDLFERPGSQRAHTLSHVHSVSNSSLGAPSTFGGTQRGRWALSHTYSGSQTSSTWRRPPPPPSNGLEARERLLQVGHPILPNQEHTSNGEVLQTQHVNLDAVESHRYGRRHSDTSISSPPSIVEGETNGQKVEDIGSPTNKVGSGDPVSPGSAIKSRTTSMMPQLQHGESDISALQAAQGQMSKHVFDLVATRSRASWLDVISSVLILCNTVFLGVQIEIGMQRARQGHSDKPQWFLIVDCAFAACFIAELSCRVLQEGKEFFTGKDSKWNIFDCLMVTTAVCDIVFEFLTALEFVNASFLRSVRVLRAARTLRIVRTTRFVRELRLMLASILSSLYSFLWAFVLIAFMVYMFSICIMQIVAEQLRQEMRDDDSYVMPQGVEEHYGSLVYAMRTLFEAISNGNDWGELMDPLTQVSGVSTFFFLFYVYFVIFGVTNILTAIFVESASKIAEVDRDLVIQANRDMEYRTARAIKTLFLTKNSGANHGTITKDALEAHLSEPQTVGYLKVLGLDVSEARGLFQLLDIEDDKAVDIEEFIGGVMRLKGSAKGVDVATLMYENKRILAKLNTLGKLCDDRFHSVLEVLGVVENYPRERRFSITA